MAKNASTNVQPTISMPSADLITYRFDQSDKKLEELKLQVSSLTLNFVTREEHDSIIKRLDNYTWYWRVIFTSLVGVVAGVILALLKR